MSLLGDNSGGVDQATQITDNLKEKEAIKALQKRHDDLLAAEARIPEKVETLDVAEKVSTVIAQCTAFDKVADAKRTEEKAPYLAAERTVDGFFNAMRDKIKDLKIRLTQKRTAYDIAVEEAERARLKREAEEAEAKAKALAADAETEQETAAASEAMRTAETKQEATQARSVDLTRTRSSAGTTSSLRTEWRHRITDPKKVPRNYCMPDEDAIKKALKENTKDGKRCTLAIKGVEFYEHKETRVR